MNTTPELFTRDGHTVVRASDGSFLRVTASTTTASAADLYRQVGERLAERAAQHAAPIPGREGISLAGNPADLAALAPALLGLDATPRSPTSPDRALIVQVVADRTQHRGLDHLAASGTGVLRCYREGDLLLIDPLMLGPEDPTGSQVLRRRIAASPAAADLNAWLDAAGEHTPGLDDLDPVALDMAGARLRQIIAAWQHNTAELPRLRRTLWMLDCATLAASEHPVLAFPEPAARPQPRSLSRP
ncbi:hypothetical protein [Mycetocola saprophilus]|uniref:hypothetical protein n=1 Tax=Mycetocola saprophilus TaxID=76636 RepID=UPI00068C301C|nr:hypothetical protein [Mycetocola saprophilus]